MSENANEIMKSTDLAQLALTLINIGADARESQIRAKEEPKVVMAYGREHLFRDGRLHLIDQPEPLHTYAPDCFWAFTLDGLVDWLKADTDKFFTPDHPAALVVVESPTQVSVYGEIQGEKKTRIKYASCRYDAPDITLNRYVDAEMLAVNIQTCFVQDEYRDTVLRIVNNMREEQSMQTSDDGISQRVNIKTGVQEVDSTIFKNPAWLCPMRTFTEVVQPASSFVVRFKEGKMAALFEADGGKWKVEAVRTIAAYLKEALKGLNMVVIG